MPAPTESRAVVARGVGYAVALAGLAVLATALHRHGHAQGDDFALYLRQARSIFDGDMGAVIADNRFAVLNSDTAFSPIGYPWGWPLVLSPFVHLWGLDYDRLKLVTVAMFCIWLVLLFGIVRRRLGRLPALGVAACVGTAPIFLLHTDQLLSEYAYFVAIAVVIWWSDRMHRMSDLVRAPLMQLVTLGVLTAVAFNVRREAVALVPVVASLQLLALIRGGGDRPTVRGFVERVRASWTVLLVPYASFIGSVVVLQLLLPTALFPDNGNSRSYIHDRWGEFPATLTKQLGLGVHPLLGVAILATAAIGVVIGIRQRPMLDTPLFVLALFSALVIGTHFRQVERYWLQVTPWVVYFAVAALVGLARSVGGRARWVAFVAAAPVVAVLVAHLVVLPGNVSDARDFDAAGRVQVGPASPTVQPIYEAVLEHTPADSVVAFFRSRTMTLLTDRRSFQTRNLDRILQSADFYAYRRDQKYAQPTLGPNPEGLVEVWSNDQWILWEVTA
jgi:hypothetical protein